MGNVYCKCKSAETNTFGTSYQQLIPCTAGEIKCDTKKNDVLFNLFINDALQHKYCRIPGPTACNYCAYCCMSQGTYSQAEVPSNSEEIKFILSMVTGTLVLRH